MNETDIGEGGETGKRRVLETLGASHICESEDIEPIM